MNAWEMELEKVEKCPQRQDSAMDQLADLHKVALQFGMYDAADLMKAFIEKKAQPVKKPNLEWIKMKSFAEIQEEIEAYERTVSNYRQAFKVGEIDRQTLKKALTDQRYTVAALKWVLGENDRFD